MASSSPTRSGERGRRFKRARCPSPATLPTVTKRAYDQIAAEDDSDLPTTVKGVKASRTSPTLPSSTPNTPSSNETLCVLRRSVPPPCIRSSRTSSSNANRTSQPASASIGVPHSQSLKDAEETVALLRSQLDKERESRSRLVSLARQDMMLDIMKERDKLKKAESDLLRERRHREMMTVEYEFAIEQHKANFEELQLVTNADRAKYLKAVSDGNAWREDAEHYKVLHRTVEEDLDELRRIENEDKTKRNGDMRGLPPAYGSLDDDDESAPYSRHKDGGNLEVATFKRGIRDQFMKAVNRSHNVHERNRQMRRESEAERIQTDTTYFYLMTTHLADACESMTEVLDNACLVAVDCVSASFEAGGEETRSATITRGYGRRSYVADRIAKLVIDLTVRLLAVMEIRPLSFQPCTAVKARLGLEYTRVDTTMSEALRWAFNESTRSDRLWEMQHFLTLVSMIQERFRHLQPGPMTSGFFDGSSIWLMENVEVQRQLVANAGAQGRATVVEGSVISSDAQGPLSPSSE